jgi:ATP-dependent helicase/nuclease subunit A
MVVEAMRRLPLPCADERRELLEDLTLEACRGAPRRRACSPALGISLAGVDRSRVAARSDRRDAFVNWRMRAGSVEDAVAELSRALGIAPEDTLESIEAEFFAGLLIPETEWPAIAAALARGNKTDVEQAQRFTALIGLTGANRIELYLEIFCTDEIQIHARIGRCAA